MFKPRTLTMRGKPIEILELEDVYAVPPSRPERIERFGTPGRRASSKKPSALGSASLQVNATDLAAFESAGWSFVEGRQPSPSARAEPAAKIYVKGGGHLAVGTDRLTVKLRTGIGESDANSFFQRYGLPIVDRLGFAPGLYQVQVLPDSARDVIDVANDLGQDSMVEFAEPEFVEFFGHRNR